MCQDRSGTAQAAPPPKSGGVEELAEEAIANGERLLLMAGVVPTRKRGAVVALDAPGTADQAEKPSLASFCMLMLADAEARAARGGLEAWIAFERLAGYFLDELPAMPPRKRARVRRAILDAVFPLSKGMPCPTA